jgi:hypothetical protein
MSAVQAWPHEPGPGMVRVGLASVVARELGCGVLITGAGPRLAPLRGDETDETQSQSKTSRSRAAMGCVAQKMGPDTDRRRRPVRGHL